MQRARRGREKEWRERKLRTESKNLKVGIEGAAIQMQQSNRIIY